MPRHLETLSGAQADMSCLAGYLLEENEGPTERYAALRGLENPAHTHAPSKTALECGFSRLARPQCNQAQDLEKHLRARMSGIGRGIILRGHLDDIAANDVDACQTAEDALHLACG